MDYSDDAAMSMCGGRCLRMQRCSLRLIYAPLRPCRFSPGQAARMQLLISQFKPTLCANMPGGTCDASKTPQPPPPPAGNSTTPQPPPLVFFS
jgi:hypothetical protein